MRNNYRRVPSFYRNKNHGRKRFVIYLLIGLTVLIIWGLSVPKIRQIIVRPLYSALSFVKISGKDILRSTLIQRENSSPYASAKTYPTLQLPEREVLFAENISELEQTDPLAELRSTPVPENEVNAAQWVYLEDYESNFSEAEDQSANLSVELPAPVFERADLFNEGPAALSAYLRFFGKEENQYQIARSIRPSAADISVTIPEMILYVQDRYEDLDGIYRLNGSAELIQNMLSAGYPVLIPLEKTSSFYFYSGDDRLIKDYVLITGFGSGTQTYTVQDPLGMGSDKILSNELLQRWYSFRRDYCLIYPKDQEQNLFEILGENQSEQRNISAASAKFKTDAESLPENPYCKANYAYTLLLSSSYEEARSLLNDARESGLPQRYLSYESGFLESYFAMGLAEELLDVSESVLRLDPQNEEVLVWQGWAFLLKEENDKAYAAFQKASQINANNANVSYALRYFESMVGN